MMKHIGLISMMACAAFMFAGCSNEFEDVFNGNNKEALSPIESSETGGVLLSGINSFLLRKTLLEISQDILGTPSITDTIAYIINDQERLSTVVTRREDNTVVEWPEIDFDKYSLVIGSVDLARNKVLDSQRLMIKNKAPVLYVKIKIIKEEYDPCDTVEWLFAKLYPKVPFDGAITMKTWQTH